MCFCLFRTSLSLQDIDDHEYPAKFMYLRDPDGVLVEVMVPA